MIPCSAPYKAVTLENLDKFTGNPVGILHLCHFIAGFTVPLPIIRFRYGHIEGNAVGMCAKSFGSSNGTSVESAGTFQITLQFRIIGDFASHGPKGIRSPVYAVEPNRFPGPFNIDKIVSDSRFRRAIHLLVQSLAARATGILHITWSTFGQTVCIEKHIFHVGFYQS